MNVTKLSSAVFAAAIGFTATIYTTTSSAGNGWMPNQPNNTYWQAPDWSGFNMPSTDYRQAPPAYYQPPQRPTNNNYGAPRPNNNAQPNMQGQMPPQNMRQQNPRQGGYPAPQRQPRGPYYGPNQGPSAFYTPGYNRNRNNNSWNKNKFFGRSGPGKWMSPNKNNMEQGWDDMINSPSRVGNDMPGGWSAPEVTMPNPVDMGDQMQDNVEDLPDQMRDMNVDN